MKIAIIGGTGLIGKAITKQLKATIVSRQGPFTIEDLVKRENFTQFDIIMNLSGRSVQALRWTQRVKQDIISSRCDLIRKITKAAIEHKHAPWLIQASGQSYYGVFEKSIHNFTEHDAPEPSDTYMQDVAFAIEKSCKAYPGHCTLMRIAPVLAPKQGIFPKLTLSSHFGLYLIPGNGKQILSWISLDDTTRAIHCILKYKIYGPVNLASPAAISIENFYKIIKSYRSRFLIHVPSIFYKIMLGEMSQLLLKGNQMYPQKLIQHQMDFKHAKIEQLFDDYIAQT